MAAWALWTVHCLAMGDDMAADCWHHTTEEETRAEAEKLARRAGWEVQTRRQGGENRCPACVKLRDSR